MSIKYAVLGYLSWKPLTGYDLKKVIANSEMLHWSGNNNQIYQALIQLHKDALITKEVESQEGAPDKHVYTITPAGLDALNEWATSLPAPPESKRPFLVQLMWADCLPPAELDALLDQYLNVIGEKLFLLRVQADRKPDTPDRTEREAYLWQMIGRNWIAHYELELSWIRQMRQELAELEKQRQRQLKRQSRQV